MKPREFFDLVSAKREKQKLYFRTRDRQVLTESKDLERRVDNEIIRVHTILEHKANNAS